MKRSKKTQDAAFSVDLAILPFIAESVRTIVEVSDPNIYTLRIDTQAGLSILIDGEALRVCATQFADDLLNGDADPGLYVDLQGSESCNLSVDLNGYSANRKFRPR